MIFGMCTGLLFLGGGTCTLGRDPADIAALVTAFFPRFPVMTTDNQYHLQALRHLYALAVKRTELRAIDVDTKEFVQVPVQIYLNELSTDVHEVRVPCLLRNSGSLHQELRVMSDKYFPCKLDLLKQNGFYSFFVQRRFADGSSFFPIHQLSQNSSSIHPFMRAYSEHFPIDMKGSERQKRGYDFLSRVIITCQKSDCPDDILPIYLKIWYGLLQLKNMDVTTRECFLWDLRLLQCYYLNWQTRPNICLLDHKILLPYIFECAGRSAESLSTS
jgi:anaphase-promoting complex subunit 1